VTFAVLGLSRVKQSQDVFVDFLTLDDGTDRLSRNVGNYQYTLRNIPDD